MDIFKISFKKSIMVIYYESSIEEHNSEHDK